MMVGMCLSTDDCRYLMNGISLLVGNNNDTVRENFNNIKFMEKQLEHASRLSDTDAKMMHDCIEDDNETNAELLRDNSRLRELYDIIDRTYDYIKSKEGEK